ncbi:MAG: tetratricopeptide repeat protein [Alphaproteobacteria bacterium]|nr:tetratricopeptide repeat protein [Alphaproteobacteria bacterium]
MAEQGVTRKLAAILAADVVGYSRLMEKDETGTLEILRKHRRDVFDPAVAKHNGRIVKLIGDGALVEFASVVNAIECAVDIQRDMIVRNLAAPDNRRMAFRIGVHLGDIIVDGDDIYGDGVNVSARLEAIALPGGICLSQQALDHVNTHLDAQVIDLGEQQVKNIARPIRAYKIEIQAPSTAGTRATTPEPVAEEAAILDRPAVAVLPFTNMSGDIEQEYFSDGLTEDLITVLSAWRSFPVIARNSSFVYKGSAVDVKKVAGELGARYILQGSVRKSGNRVRITAQLIDASTNHHIFAEKYDRHLQDIFDLQDEITQTIAAIVAPQLELAEQRKSVEKKSINLDAWDYHRRGMAYLYQFDRDGNIQARNMFDQAIQVDPAYTQPYIGRAYSHQLDILSEFTDDREASIQALYHDARQAIALDDSDSMAHVMLCFACRWDRAHDLALTEARKAVRINPSNAFAHFLLGNILDLVGDPDAGIESIQKAIQLNPRDPRMHLMMSVLARVYLNARQYQSAVETASAAINRRADHPRAHVVLAISLGYLGRDEEAQAALSVCEFLSAGYARRWAELREYRDQADNAHIMDGLVHLEDMA